MDCAKNFGLDVQKTLYYIDVILDRPLIINYPVHFTINHWINNGLVKLVDHKGCSYVILLKRYRRDFELVRSMLKQLYDL